MRPVLLCLLSLFLICQSAEAQEAAPKLVFTRKLYDFRQTVQGKTVHHTFTFKNIGTAPLKIYKVDPSCVCALLKKPKEAIAPGETGEIEVAFETDEKIGFHTVYVVVYSNDSSQADRGANTTVLRIRGEILTMYRIQPPVLGLGRVTKGVPSKPRIVKVVAKGSRTFKILKLLKSSEHLNVKWEKKGEQFLISVTLKQDAPIGQVNVDLVFQTDLKRQPKLRVPVYATVSTIYETPPMILLDRGKPGQKLNISVLRFDGHGLEVLGIDYDRKRFTLASKVVQPGKRLDLQISVRKDATPGPFSGYVTLRMANKDQPIIKIPTLGMIYSILEYEPKAVFIDKAVKSGEELVKIEITGAKNGAKDILEASIAKGPAKVTTKFEGERCFLIVEATKDSEKGDFKGLSILVKTSVGGQKLITIPFLPR